MFFNKNKKIIKSGVCPVCLGKLIERGFAGHNRRWECDTCEYLIEDYAI